MSDTPAQTLDLNADLGEINTPDGHASDAAILGVVSSASIACGGHAGDAATMTRAVTAAHENGVRIGAHPAYPDREGFGRTPGFAIAHEDLRDTLLQQVRALQSVAKANGARVAYIKPHGALYNDAVMDPALAGLIAGVAAELDLPLMGAPDSCLQQAATTPFLAEGFIDRRYSASGHLVSRTEPGAVLATDAERLAQLESLARDRKVTTADGTTLPLACDTLCLHGDSLGAMATARAARARLEALGFAVSSSGVGD